MKIYYASSVKGTNSQAKSFFDSRIIEHLLHEGAMNGGHIINGLYDPDESEFSAEIVRHNVQLNWLWESDAVIVEVSNPSTEVGYVLGRAMEFNKKVLCLYRQSGGNPTSMISGSDRLIIESYDNIREAISKIDEFLKNIVINHDHDTSTKGVNKRTLQELSPREFRHRRFTRTNTTKVYG